MERKLRIKNRWIKINRLFIILIAMIIAFTVTREFLTIYTMNNYYESSIYEAKSDDLEQEVSNRIDEIDLIKIELEDDFRQELTNQVLLVDYFASEQVANLDGVPTLEEKRDVYIDSIYQYDLSEDDFLFFSMDTLGMSWLMGLNKSGEHTSIYNLEDPVTGELIVVSMIDVVSESQSTDGFVTYYWPKEIDGAPIMKTSYVYYNEEVDLIIGTGKYLDEYLNDVQNEFIKKIDAYYEDTEDYIFMIGYDGAILEHGSADFTTEDLLEVYTTDGEVLHDYVVSKLENNSSVWVDYIGPNNDLDAVNKRGYFTRIKGWDMYIGQALYTDDVDEMAQQYLKSTRAGLIITILGMTVITSSITLYIKKHIDDNFNDVQDEFKEQKELIAEYSLKDSLTGLYNRKYFDTAFINLKDSNAKQYSIIQGDANGLKITNDAFGHNEGDKLLIFISSTLKMLFPNDAVFRWGGDEFVVLSQIDNETVIKEKLKEFHRLAGVDTQNKVNASVSFGYSISAIDSDPYMEINVAEVMMYERKTLESTSTKRKIIDNILESLYDSISFEEEHSNNVMENALLIGGALGFSSLELSKLRLGALMHDIGKIGIPDSIIQKPGKLTNEEYNEIKQHSEKGFRILSAYPELSEYGYIVLHHHERYDGKGYPRKLKGEDIPLHSRIITVSDAYDAMVQERVYKDKFTMNQAFDELIKNKSTQFDPHIVDVFIKSKKNK